MPQLPSEVLVSLHRSRVRRRALAALARLGRAYPADIARGSGLALRQVRLALRGSPPDYREPLSLSRVGLARTARFVGGRHEFEITPLGLEAARATAAGEIGEGIIHERGLRAAMAEPPAPNPANPRVKLQTTAGDLVVELFEKDAPVSTKNFLEYVKSGHYDGTVFHRVIKGFVVQGGGFDTSGRQKPTKSPIKLEINYPTLQHWDGALSMARTAVRDSATSQFYLCHGAQKGLDREYAVFGVVREGKSVVDKIATSPTGSGDKPKTDVVLTRARVL